MTSKNCSTYSTVVDTNAVASLAEGIQSLHCPIPQALLNKALAHVLDATHPGDGNQRQRTLMPLTAQAAFLGSGR